VRDATIVAIASGSLSNAAFRTRFIAFAITLVFFAEGGGFDDTVGKDVGIDGGIVEVVVAATAERGVGK
jgi:hypothetical protein